MSSYMSEATVAEKAVMTAEVAEDEDRDQIETAI
jgi:hypothetical protein